MPIPSCRDTEEDPDTDIAIPDLSPTSRDASSRDPPSEMDYDDENKENIDPLLQQGDGKENVPRQIKGREIVPLAPRIVLRDARRSLRNRDVNGSFPTNQDAVVDYHDTNTGKNVGKLANHDIDSDINHDHDIDKIRRSTEQLNISDSDHLVRVSMPIFTHIVHEI